MKVGATLNIENGTINYGPVSERLQHHYCDNVNFTNVDDIVVPESIKGEFKSVFLNRAKAFSTSYKALPLNTSVVATIRTTITRSSRKCTLMEVVD